MRNTNFRFTSNWTKNLYNFYSILIENSDRNLFCPRNLSFFSGVWKDFLLGNKPRIKKIRDSILNIMQLIYAWAIRLSGMWWRLQKNIDSMKTFCRKMWWNSNKRVLLQSKYLYLLKLSIIFQLSHFRISRE